MESGAEDVLVVMEQLRKEMTDMRQTIHSLHAQVASLTRRNQQSTKEKNVLKSRIKELEQRLSKYEQPGKNSSNSLNPNRKPCSLWLYILLIPSNVLPLFSMSVSPITKKFTYCPNRLSERHTG